MRAETGDFKGSIDGVESDAWGRYRAEISSADTREFWACWPQVPLPYSDASPAQTCPGAFEHERLAIGDRATGDIRRSVRRDRDGKRVSQRMHAISASNCPCALRRGRRLDASLAGPRSRGERLTNP